MRLVLSRLQVRKLFDRVVGKAIEFLQARLEPTAKSSKRSQPDIQIKLIDTAGDGGAKGVLQRVILTGGLIRNRYVKSTIEAALQLKGIKTWTRICERDSRSHHWQAKASKRKPLSRTPSG